MKPTPEQIEAWRTEWLRTHVSEPSAEWIAKLAFAAGMEAAVQVVRGIRGVENDRWNGYPAGSSERARCVTRAILADEIVSAIRKAKEES